MSWIQLGLFIERNLPVRIDPTPKKPSRSKPIRKVRKPTGVKLQPGELDDDISDLWP